MQKLEFCPRLNLIAGLNGMGKTNLLDAVYYLCMGKSHFTSTDRNVVRQGESFFRLEGQFVFDEKPRLPGGRKEKITAKVQPGKQKVFEKNKSAYLRLSDHVGLLPVVFNSPDDTALALEGSEARRRFLDNTLCQLDSQYLTHLVSYNRLLQKRNALLKQFAEQRTFNAELLEVLGEQMAAPALFIFEKRKTFVDAFSPVFNRYHQIICGGNESVDCQYRSQLLDNQFSELLKNAVEKDRILQRTTAGTHKDDLRFRMDGRPLKRFASQGQLKSFVLALKLAQFDCLKNEKETMPILLLDDLFDKLDVQRVEHLLELLVKGDFGQVFITDTHPERSEEIAKHFGSDYEKFIIVHGSVGPK